MVVPAQLLNPKLSPLKSLFFRNCVWLEVATAKQELRLWQIRKPVENWDIFSNRNDLTEVLRLNSKLQELFRVSTAKNGLGEKNGSLKTPRGWHYVGEKIGSNLPKGAVLKARKWTGEIYQKNSSVLDPILSRALWLFGLEPEFNLFGNVDSRSRYIYVHGSPDFSSSTPSSQGCIRLSAGDICRLYELCPWYCLVLLH